MSQLRRQSIITTLVIFLGFAIGFINSLLFTNKSWFTESQYGVSKSIFDFAQLIYALTFLGITSVIYKFYPYYKAHIKKENNDLLTWSVISTTLMFLLVAIAMYFGKVFFVKKFIAKSPELISYYFWLLPLAYFLMLFYILEAHLWTLNKAPLASFLREVFLRLYHLVLIILFISKVISFDVFIKYCVFTYAILCFVAILYLISKNEIYFVLKPSLVTKKFIKKIMLFGGFIYLGTIVIVVSSLMDSFSISSFIGQNGIGILSIITFICNLIIIPQRSIVAVMIPPLASAWREKNISFITNVYKRSSINMLLASLVIFGCIWLNFENAVNVLHMNPIYLTGKWLLFFLGLKAIVDMGTGVNGQIIATSNYWRFEFLTGIVLLLLVIPLNYFLIQKMGIVGAGIANLIAYSVYNLIRVAFLWKKYRMQPFSKNTLFSLFFAVLFYFLIYFMCQSLTGWSGIVIKSCLYTFAMVFVIGFFKLSPDFWPVVHTIKKRLHLTK